MGKVTALMMDTITEKSGHSFVPNAVSVCITPAAPSPLPIPYPVFGMAANGITDPPMRTKINGSKIATTGSVIKSCNGNEPGTLKEVVSLNTGGPIFIIMGAPVVLCELGMMGITTSMCISNKAITVGAGATASGAGGAGGGGGGAGGGGGGGPSAPGTQGPAGGGGSGGGGSNTGASAAPPNPNAPTAEERELARQPGNSPEQRAAREKVGQDFFESRGMGAEWPSARNGLDMSQPVEVVNFPPPDTMDQYVRRQQRGAPPGTPGGPGNWFSPVPGQTGDQVGLNDDPAHRTHRSFDTTSGGQALSSTAAPINDTWTDPANPRSTAGGGKQYTVDNDTRDRIAADNPATPSGTP